MTVFEAKKAAIAEYVKIWGRDWVDSRIPAIFTESTVQTQDNIFEYSITVDEQAGAASGGTEFAEFYAALRAAGGENFDGLPAHRTTFVFDLGRGTMERVEHF